MTDALHIAPNGRAIIVGPTGSGKTELAKELLRTIGARQGLPARSVIVVDPKHMFAWDDPHPRFGRIATSLAALVAQLHETERDASYAPIIYRPPDPTDYAGNDRVAAIALERRHTTLYYDELSLVTGPGDPRYSAPQWARAMVTGRQLGVGVINATQRPVAIPKIARTEAEQRYTFFLRDAHDRDVVDAIFGGGIPWDTLADHEYSFVYASDRTMRTRAALQPLRLSLTPHVAAAAAV